MVPAALIIKIIFLLQAAGLVTVWLYWIQTKEYRLDRFTVFLKNPDGIRELLVIPTLIKFFIFAVCFVFNPFLLLYLVEILLLAIYFVIQILKRKLRKPVFTKRVVRICLISLVFTFTTLFLYQTEYWVRFFLSELTLLVGPLVGIYVTGISVKNTLEREKKTAKDILEKFSPTVIAITGSYGKTTTKDFITQILSSKYIVLSTFKNQNTHFGIVRRIISDLKKNHKFFVVEIGAYKKDEIRKIAEVLKPDVAVITGLEPQHLELFGTFENLKRAKFELVESLGEKGLAFFNITNPEVTTLENLARRLGKNIKTYTYALNNKGRLDATSHIERIDSDGATFKITIDDETKEIRTNLYSKRLIENLTGAILVARRFGVEWARIREVCRKLDLPDGTLNVFKTKSGLTIIDDSYNSTPHGFEAAIELLSQKEGKKKLVATTGIIELGDQSYVIHKKLGELLDAVCDLVILRNKEFITAFKDGMRDPTKIRLITDSKKIINLIDKNTNSKSIVLIEGKLPWVVDHYRKI